MLMILSCFKNLEHISYIKSCWLEKCPLPYVIILGDENLDTEYTYDQINKILKQELLKTQSYGQVV